MKHQLHFKPFLLLSLLVFLLGSLQTKAQDPELNGTGTITYDSDYGSGVKQISASFSEGKIVISDLNLYHNYYPITFEIDLTNGTATSIPNTIAEYDGSWAYYYGQDEKPFITATIKNTGVSSCEMIWGDWGIGELSGDEMDIYDNYYDTSIIFEFAIPGLIGETGGGGENPKPDPDPDPDPGPGGDTGSADGTGTITYDSDYGSDVKQISASFSEGKIVISDLNLYHNYYPITFEIDLTSGTATSIPNTIAEYDGSWAYYYGQEDKPYITATIKNTGASSCEMLWGDWGIGELSGDEMDIYDNYYDTSIIFDFAIPGLIGETGGGGENPNPDPDPEPGPGGDTGSAEGTGTITYDSDYGSGVKQISASYSDGKLVISDLNLYHNYYPITFEIDLTSGIATSIPNTIAEYDGDWPYYYGQDEKPFITATIKNTGASSCEMIWGDWGIGELSGDEMEFMTIIMTQA